jgi:uncharacterized membrane protein YfcA
LLSTTLAVTAILALAMVARSAFGFGHGAFAMPLLVLVIDVKTATPLLGAVSFIVSIVALAQSWRQVQLSSATWLILGALPGIPVGVAALLLLNPRYVLGALAVLLTLLSLRGLLGIPLPQTKNDRLGLVFGFIGGILGGAFNLIGIPVAVFGAMRGWSPAEFRTTLTGFFLVTGFVSLVGYGAAGLMDATFFQLTVLSLVPAFLGDALGKRIGHQMSRQTFERWIWSLILLTSALLFYKVAAG